MKKGLLYDERGGPSSARAYLAVVLAFSLLVIYLDSASAEFAVATEAYGLLAGAITGLTAWAGGARIAQYIGPQVGAVVRGIASRVGGGTSVAVSVDDHRVDDER